MKTKLFCPVIISCFLLSTIASCGTGTKQNFSEEKVILTLKSFYTEYITVGNKPLSAEYLQELKKTRENYCTQQLLDRLDSLRNQEKLDFDPFTHAQDFNANWLQTMIIKKDSAGENIYSVSLWDDYCEDYKTIKMSVVKEKEWYKIDSLAIICFPK